MLSGCGTGALPQAVIPNGGHDPARDPRCKDAEKRTKPLVTEWNASEKANLEAALQNGAVAVAYTGCELIIVESCQIPGKYEWHKTTLSTDTVEIRDADELFAKLPLGAVALEGELKTSGSLNVKTTVSGQLKLTGKAATEDTSGAECEQATHIVTGLSIGAFKLAAGGEVVGKAGVEAGGRGVRGGTNQSKSIDRAAGDPASCARATDGKPDAGCRSPIQVYLRKIRRSVPLHILGNKPEEG